MTFYVIICHDKINLYRSTHQKLQNHVFQHGDLELWLIQDIVRVNPHTKFWVHTSNGSAARELTDAHTHRQTDGTDFIPSTADAGGNKTCSALTLRLLYHISTYVVIFLTGSVLYHISTYVVFCDWCGMILGTVFITPSAPQLFFFFSVLWKILKIIFHGRITLKKQKAPKIIQESSGKHWKNN